MDGKRSVYRVVLVRVTHQGHYQGWLEGMVEGLLGPCPTVGMGVPNFTNFLVCVVSTAVKEDVVIVMW